MKNARTSLLYSACIALALVAAGSAFAAEDGNIFQRSKLSASLKGQMTVDDNEDLGLSNEDTLRSESVEGKVRLTVPVTRTTTAFSEVRGVKNYGDGRTVDLDTGETSSGNDFLELRQLWVEQDELFGQLPWAVRIGRQRFSEPYALWWNRDFDAARLIYDTTLFRGFVAVGQNLASYRTSGDDFNKENEDILRVLAETSWQYRYQQFFETRFAYQDDHSGMERAGDIIDPNNRDTNDDDLFWGGVRFQGTAPAVVPGIDGAQYRLDVMGVAGQSDTQLSSAGPGSSRTVTGHDKNDVLGWALDAGLNIPLPVYSKPLLMLGYAYGSGDSDPNDNTDHAFRQTGLDSNSSRLGLASGTIYHYGFALRPDLSNIHILTAGLGVPLFKASDVSALYHYYRLAEKATDLSSSGVNADLNGQDKFLGQGADLVMNLNLGEEFNMQPGVLDGVVLRTTVGAFKAGKAYGAGEDEVATRGLMELLFRF